MFLEKLRQFSYIIIIIVSRHLTSYTTLLARNRWSPWVETGTSIINFSTCIQIIIEYYHIMNSSHVNKQATIVYNYYTEH